jgi:hypothetical protein
VVVEKNGRITERFFDNRYTPIFLENAFKETKRINIVALVVLESKESGLDQ